MNPLRHPRRAWVAALGLLLGGASAFAALPAGHVRGAAQDGPGDLAYACARGKLGVLHAVDRPAACHGRGSVAVAFASDRPVHVCRNDRAGGGPDGLVRLVYSPGGCAPGGPRNGTAHALPGHAVTRFCAGPRTRRLRWVAAFTDCFAHEQPMLLHPAGDSPRSRLRAGDDAADTSEDRPVAVDVLANDRPGLAGRALHLVSVGRRHRAAARIGRDATIRYRPNGRFESLGDGDVAHATIPYRVSDGVHTARATLRVTIHGVNDAPTPAEDAASATEDSMARIDVVKAAAPAGTPGKDTDPEGDTPLLPHLVSSTSDGGAALSLGADHRVLYDPRAAFQSLGGGQTQTDSFRYTESDPGGATSQPASVRVRVIGLNDAPVLTGVGSSTASFVAGSQPQGLFRSAGVSDPDNNAGLGGATMGGATARITSGFVSGHDRLTVNAPAGVMATWDASTGTLTLKGAASRHDYVQALRSIAFDADLGSPAAARTVSLQVDDGARHRNLSTTVERTVHVENVNLSATPSLTPAFSPAVSDYAIHCTSGQPIAVSANAPDGTTVSIDGDTDNGGSSERDVTLSAGQGFSVLVKHGDASTTYHARCLPSDFPPYSAQVTGTPQAQWYLTAPAFGQNPSHYLIVFDNDGVPVWWHDAGAQPVDFKLLPNGHFAWGQAFNNNAYFAFTERRMDASEVRQVQTVGYGEDFHESALLPNGHYLLITYRPRDHVDLSAYGGPSDATVQDGEIQELTADGKLVWSWNTKDHIALSESARWMPSIISSPVTLPDSRTSYDIVHMNAVDPHGNVMLVSLRHTDAVYEINRTTGDVMWKLGGTQTAQSLTVKDDPFSDQLFGGQHDSRLLPDGTVTVFDNGTNRPRAPRAVRYGIDETARTATLLESITDPQNTTSFCCGSARRLSGGDWMVNWGSRNQFEELTSSSSPVLRVTFTGGPFSYRTVPVEPGVLSASALRDGMDEQFPR